jgi:hypothetical protein
MICGIVICYLDFSQTQSYPYCFDARQIIRSFADKLIGLLHHIDSIDTLQLLQTTHLSEHAQFRRMGTDSAGLLRTVL